MKNATGLKRWKPDLRHFVERHFVCYDTSSKVFVEWSLRRTQLCRRRHLVEIFPLVSDAKINHGVDAILDTVFVMDCGNCRR